MKRQSTKLEICPDALLGCRLFDRLGRGERAYVVRFCEGRRYQSGAEIIRYGEDERDVFFVLSGEVQTSMYTKSGKVFYFQSLKRGKMFGELAALDGKLRSTSVVAVGETCVVRMSGENFKDVVARYPNLSERVMLRLCDLSRFLVEHAITMHAFSVPDQIRLEICRIVKQYPAVDNRVRIEHAPTHEDIAFRVGTLREQVTRVMPEFTKSGLIEKTGKGWIVHDVQGVCRRAPEL